MSAVTSTSTIENKLLKAAPELQAERNAEHQWRVWCRYCKCYHYHGAEPGHRRAHCLKRTPYTETGYVLLAPIDPNPVVLEDNPKAER